MSRKPWSASFVVDVEVVLPGSLSEPMIHDIRAFERDPTLLQLSDVTESSKILTLLVSVALVAMDPYALSLRSLGGTELIEKGRTHFVIRS